MQFFATTGLADAAHAITGVAMRAKTPSRRSSVRHESAGEAAEGAPAAAAPLAAFVLLAVLVGFTGGSSRYDAFGLVVLQPVAWLLVAYGIALATTRPLGDVKVPLAILCGTGLWTALQLVPLPPWLWTALPGRAPIEALDQVFGQDGWRTISLVPSRTLNALAALGVPLAAMLIATAVAERRADTPAHLVCGLALVSAIWTFAQASGIGGARFYIYSDEVHNGLPGLFANPNHAGVFAAVGLIWLGKAALDAERAHRPGLATATAFAWLLVLVAGVIAGSRAGWIACCLALIVNLLIFLGAKRRSIGWSRAAVASAVLLAVILAVVSRLTGTQDIRAELWPPSSEAAMAFLPVGAGFGSFEETYQIFETGAVLRREIVNMAHNDWLQLVLEGGLPAIALLALAIAWLVAAIRRHQSRGLAIALSGTAIIVALASVVDYPMRTPMFQFAAGLLVARMALGAKRAGH